MRSDQQATWIPSFGIMVLDDLQPGLVKTPFHARTASGADPHMGRIDMDDLLGMGAAALTIDSDADDDDL
jgi:small ligand-binding sensory domain FIST